MRIRLKKENNELNSNIFWVTMTDLMTALVLIFIVLFFYSYITNYYDNVKSTFEQKRMTSELKITLEKQNLNANVDAITGVVKISDLELFELNSYSLSARGKAYLDKFAPTYLNSIFSNPYMNQNVDKIVIQGHADTQIYKGHYSDDEQCMKNMELSLRRAYEVANYIMNTPYNKENGARLRKMIIVEGAGSSMPIIINNKEDYAKSRRVELKIIMKSRESKT